MNYGTTHIIQITIYISGLTMFDINLLSKDMNKLCNPSISEAPIYIILGGEFDKIGAIWLFKDSFYEVFMSNVAVLYVYKLKPIFTSEYTKEYLILGWKKLYMWIAIRQYRMIHLGLPK